MSGDGGLAVQPGGEEGGDAEGGLHGQGGGGPLLPGAHLHLHLVQGHIKVIMQWWDCFFLKLYGQICSNILEASSLGLPNFDYASFKSK